MALTPFVEPEGTGPMEAIMLQSEDLKLETRRLILCRPSLEDAPTVHCLIANWNVAKWLSRVPFPYPESAARDWIMRMSSDCDAGTQYSFGLYPKSLHEQGPLGNVGLYVNKSGEWEIGYWLGEPHWGQGLMGEATQRVVQFAFEDAKIERVTSGHFIGNAGSARVLLRCGFEYTGESRRWCEARGHDVDAMDMELSAAKWRAYRPAQAAE